MIDARFIFMDPPAKRSMLRSRFRSTYGQTLRDLESELLHLRARSIVINAGFRSVRNDGWPYAAARPDHPACKLQFVDRNGNTLVFRGEQYNSFEDNLRAIAMTLEALRAVDRYGVVKGEQYAGFKQLGQAAPPAPPMNALDVLCRLSGLFPADVLANPRRAFLFACKRHHPDAGGERSNFEQAQKAYEIMSK